MSSRRFRGLIQAAAGAIVLLATAAEAQPVSSCRFPTNDVPVWFNPNMLTAYNLDPALYREAVFDTIAIWRAQSMSGVNFYYAGDTTLTTIPGAVVVNHDDNLGADTALARTGSYPGSCPGSAGVWVAIHMRDGNGVFRNWTPYWPGPLASVPGSPTSYEGVLLHEIGHGVFGFPDLANSAVSVMVGQMGQTAANYILYPNDITGAVGAYGSTPETTWTISTSNNGASWTAPSAFDGSTAASLPPSLIPTDDATQPVAGVLTSWSSSWMRVNQGNHGFFSPYTSVPTTTVWHQPSISVSSFGETMVVLPTVCARTTSCPILWAWTANDGVSWQTGTLLSLPATGTFGRPLVHYDSFRDRFVLAYLSGTDAELYTMWTAAASTSWSAATRARPSSDTFPKPFRSLGGLVFDGAGLGLIAATAHWDGPNTIGSGSVITPITQSNLTWNGSQYALSATSYSRWYSTRGEARTRVPFGLARASSGQIFMAWRGTSGARRLTFATKSSMSATSWFSVPTEIPTEVANGVTVAPASTSFVAGFSD